MKRLLPVLTALIVPALVWAAVPKKRPEDDVKGQELWERSCWMCHGAENKGDGPAAAALPGGVPDLSGTIKGRDFEPLVDIILYGKGAMPAFDAEMDRHNARRILIYLAKVEDEGLPPRKATPAPDEGEDEDEAGGDGVREGGD
ncbi:MAG: cytochrome c [Alphaproteobacteria bacterium]|nr:cytochrome c [Alphaproteobacteria bacterium]